MLNDFDEINAILSQLANDGTIEPIDEADCHPLDWAEVVGVTDEIFDEVYPCQEAFDDHGQKWYIV